METIILQVYIGDILGCVLGEWRLKRKLLFRV